MHIILAAYIVSLPAWGVRVEIRVSGCAGLLNGSLPAWGVRVEINSLSLDDMVGKGHSPHGECGLKYRP